MRVRVTMVAELDLNPKFYPEGADARRMVDIDLENDFAALFIDALSLEAASVEEIDLSVSPTVQEEA